MLCFWFECWWHFLVYLEEIHWAFCSFVICAFFHLHTAIQQRGSFQCWGRSKKCIVFINACKISIHHFLETWTWLYVTCQAERNLILLQFNHQFQTGMMPAVAKIHHSLSALRKVPRNCLPKCNFAHTRLSLGGPVSTCALDNFI